MIRGPIRPAQNALVILALFSVAGSLLPWSPPIRFVCAAGGIGIILLLLMVRLRMHAGNPADTADRIARARVERIRAERAARMGRRR